MEEGISPDVLRDFEILLKVEIDALDSGVQRSVQMRIGEINKAGYLRSGRAMLYIAQEFADTIPKRCQVATSVLMRSLSEHGFEITNSNKQFVIAKLHAFIDDTNNHLKALARSTAPFRLMASFAENALEQIRTNSETEKQRIIGEINLMAARKSIKLDDLANTMLVRLRGEFIDAGRQSSDLNNGYVGPNLNDFEEEILSDTGSSKVDFDLSLKSLEDGHFAKTGPVVPYENKPGSGLFIVAAISKREYIYLTELGYRTSANVRSSAPARSPNRTTVHISGGTFHQSPIGVGETVTQSLNFDVTDESKSVTYLAGLLEKTGRTIDASTNTELTQMIQSANAGDMKSAKPIFQKLFGAAEETVKQLAYGVLTTIITKQMGM